MAALTDETKTKKKERVRESRDRTLSWSQLMSGNLPAGLGWLSLLPKWKHFVVFLEVIEELETSCPRHFTLLPLIFFFFFQMLASLPAGENT